MTLTMTRTRTQTTLTRLAKLLANLNGELEFVERLLAEMPEYGELLAVRREELADTRTAAALTLKQFDLGLDTGAIAPLNDWARAFGRPGSKAAVRKYLAALSRHQLPQVVA